MCCPSHFQAKSHASFGMLTVRLPSKAYCKAYLGLRGVEPSRVDGELDRTQGFYVGAFT